MLSALRNNKILLLILVMAFLIRIVNFSFPLFTSDEARIAFRGYSLSHFGKDELGRNLSLIFNSLTDYQLPVASYLAALGSFVFGKTDFAVRTPFIFIGIGIVFLSFKIGRLINPKKTFAYCYAGVMAFSPVLIFLSKIPNESILLIFFMQLIFYTQLKSRKIYLVVPLLIISLLISKTAWLILPPFLIFNLFLNTQIDRKVRLKYSILFVFITLIIGFSFLKIPQFTRSLLENNFPYFLDTSTNPALNQLRGQGMDADWKPFLERILFNKSHYLTISLIHYLSNLSPGIYFGQFDSKGLFNYSQMGVIPKIAIIPFALGVVYLLSRKSGRLRLLLLYIPILIYPSLFNYPNYDSSLLVLIVPIIALIAAFGLVELKKGFIIMIFSLIILEVFPNVLYISPEIRNTNNLRPTYIKTLTGDIYNSSTKGKVVVSDNVINEDIVPFIEWYNFQTIPSSLPYINYPYKYRQFILDSIQIIGSDRKILACEKIDYPFAYLSDRDINKINKLTNKISKTYKDGKDIAYVPERGLCIQ